MFKRSTDKARKKPTLSEKALDWDDDRVTRARRSATIGWSIAGALGITTVALGFAIAHLAPLKTVEPYVIRVDNSTGIVEVMSALEDTPQTYDEAIDESFLAQYVRSRERYSPESLSYDYRKVVLMSSESVKSDYTRYMSNRNENSPVNIYGNDGRAEIEIRSITHLESGVAQVRFGKRTRRTTRNEYNQTEWIATITYDYVSAKMSERDRLLNPLGFQAMDYRVNDANMGG